MPQTLWQWAGLVNLTQLLKGPAMPKEEWGTKRVCPTTGKRFYDLNRNPIVSPYTGEIVVLDTSTRSRTMIADKADPNSRADVEEDDDVILEDDDDAVDTDIDDDVLDEDDEDDVSLDDIADVAADEDDS
jgi:uncharacterized protein (TIGR02300 family)